MKKEASFLAHFAADASHVTEGEWVMNIKWISSTSGWFFAGYNGFSPFFTRFSPIFQLEGFGFSWVMHFTGLNYIAAICGIRIAECGLTKRQPDTGRTDVNNKDAKAQSLAARIGRINFAHCIHEGQGWKNMRDAGTGGLPTSVPTAFAAGSVKVIPKLFPKLLVSAVEFRTN